MLKLSVPMERSRKIRLIKKNDIENDFRMNKLWIFEETLLMNDNVILKKKIFPHSKLNLIK